MAGADTVALLLLGAVTACSSSPDAPSSGSSSGKPSGTVTVFAAAELGLHPGAPAHATVKATRTHASPVRPATGNTPSAVFPPPRPGHLEQRTERRHYSMGGNSGAAQAGCPRRP
ncbi:hypothetical protein [Streptomyces sp. NPDC050388]|uniref:hypothetical protein n=1 Tax=Streptomyces sp. NPDC050388 TaxID=3155781 RepID=UPI00343AE5E9